MWSGCWAACRPWCRPIDQGARLLAAAVAEPAIALKRRELIPTLQGTFPSGCTA